MALEASNLLAGAAAELERLRLQARVWEPVMVSGASSLSNQETGVDQDPGCHRRYSYPVGISSVIVNGEVVVDSGEHTGALPGRVLRRGPDGVG